MTPPPSLLDGAGQLAAAVRAKAISAAELVRLTFEAIDRRNPAINAIVWQFRDAAIARAKEADEALARGADVGPLHGVPITIKEAFAYRGSPNTWGLPHLARAMSPRTATAVERLEAAGAIVIGKTNVPVMLGDWQTFNSIYGVTNNPWDASRTAGGSTGGGAAAIAAGLGALALGSDLSGSIRIPAHFCGVYGHKPSLELVSTAGFQPGPWDGSPGYPMDLSTSGPIARRARDLSLALGAAGGPSGDDAAAWTWRMPAPRHTRLGDFRIGYVFEDDAAPIVPEIQRMYDEVLGALRAAGARIDRGWPDRIDPHAQMATYGYLLGALVTAEMDEAGRTRARERFARNPDDIFAAAAVEPHARWLRETQRRLACRAQWQRYFGAHDVFLLPVTPTPAFPHDHSQPMEKRTIETGGGARPYVEAIPFWIAQASLAGLPATVAPVGRTAAGLPVGIQIVAPMWEDGTSIEFADRLAEITGGFAPPP